VLRFAGPREHRLFGEHGPCSFEGDADQSGEMLVALNVERRRTMGSCVVARDFSGSLASAAVKPNRKRAISCPGTPGKERSSRRQKLGNTRETPSRDKRSADGGLPALDEEIEDVRQQGL
jgi:hypothetical protein